MNADDSLATLLRNTHELETFLHDFISQLAKRRLKPGEDVTRYAGELGLKMPAALRGIPITWAGEAESATGIEGGREETLVLARPGIADAVGLTIGCIRIGRFKICLECGWFYCRIVIKGTF